MTREEAIERLNERKEVCYSKFDIEAIDMGVAALERWRGAEDALDHVLEIIAIRKSSVAYDQSEGYTLACDAIEHLVLKLKGDKE